MSKAYVFSPALPTENHGIGTAIAIDIQALKLSYSEIIFVTSSSSCINEAAASYPDIEFVRFSVSGNHRPYSFYKGEFLNALRYMKSATGHLYFYCWHTPFVDLIPLLPFSRKRHIYLVSHGTFCSPRLLLNGPRFILSLGIDLIYCYWFIPAILKKVDRIFFLSLSLDSERSTDLRCCLKYFPEKISLNPNANLLKNGLDHDQRCKYFIDDLDHLPVDRCLDLILISSFSRAKGMDSLYKFIKSVSSILSETNAPKRSIRIHLFSYYIPTALPWRLDKLKHFSSGCLEARLYCYSGMCAREIKELISNLPNPIALSLSRTECEPFALTEPLSLYVPCIALKTGSIPELPGVISSRNLSRLAGILCSYMLSSHANMYMRYVAMIGGAFMRGRAIFKDLAFSSANYISFR